MVDRIPILLLTGFLGSGKTTLLSRAMPREDAGDTLVLVNEIGEVGLDHDLLWQGGDVPLVLENGCICCTVGDDLLTTLEDLFWARLHRRIPHFARVVIETTGLADPRPIVEALTNRPLILERFRYGGTITAVGVPTFEDVLEWKEGLAQISAADHVVLTKTDQAKPERTSVARDRIAEINPIATIETGADVGAGLLQTSAFDAPQVFGQLSDDRVHRHGHGVTTLTVPLSPMSDKDALVAASSGLAALAPRLLRAKGIAELNGAPMLMQVVGGVASPPEPCPGKPDGKALGKLVVIGTTITQEDVRAALGPLAG